MDDEVRVEDSEFIVAIVVPADKISEGNQPQAHYCFKDKTGDTLYFKRKQFPKFEDSVPNDQTKRVLDFATNEFLREYKESRKFKCFLKYFKLIISYPFACFLHEPIITFNKYKKTLKTLPQKLNLMYAIAKSVEQLHQQQVQMRTLRPSIIVVLQYSKKDPVVAFTEIGRRNTKGIDSKLNQSAKQLDIYMAPQCSPDKKTVGSTAGDIWSLGLVFCEILFEQSLTKQSFNKSHELILPQNISPWISQFVGKMVSKNPIQRQKIRDIIVTLRNAKLCFQNLCKD